MNYAPRARFTLEITRYGLLLLLALYTLQIFAVTPFNWTMLAVGTLPVLLMLPAVWRGQPVAHAWLCFILLLYFLVAVQNMFSPNRDALDIARLVLVVIIFLAAMMYVRWGSRALRAAQQTDDKMLAEHKELNEEVSHD